MDGSVGRSNSGDLGIGRSHSGDLGVGRSHSHDLPSGAQTPAAADELLLALHQSPTIPDGNQLTPLRGFAQAPSRVSVSRTIRVPAADSRHGRSASRPRRRRDPAADSRHG